MMNFNTDFNRSLNDRAKAQAEIQDIARKEKNRLELPDESKRDHMNFSYKAQRRKRIVDNLIGTAAVILVLFFVYWFLTNVL